MTQIYKLLLKQHIGNPDSPCVKEGDVVKRGSRIASANGLGADLHASVSGKVIKVTPEAILIKGDKPEKDEFESLRPGTIAERVRSAGIVGMGGAGFPTGIKLSQKISGGTVIVNAAECEPILLHNIAQIESNPDEVYRGLLYAMEAVDAARGVIAIKAKHKKAVSLIKEAINDDRVSVFLMPDLYPVGEERALIRDILGKLLPPEERVITANAIVINSETLSRVTQAVELGRPAVSKNLTIAGKLYGGAKSIPLMDVPIGTRIGDLIESVGGIDGDYGEILMGGPFTGHRVTLDDVVTKTSGGIIVTMPFLKERSPIGLLVCACSADETRMKEMAYEMGGDVVDVQKCKYAVKARGALRCQNPGVCPGQADRLLKLRKAGAKAVLIGNCSDCTNTVMQIAPKLHLHVHHVTDSAMRAMGLHLIRKLH
ncbi:proline reductase-associated electron transfer protein PrdC [Sporolactobacillus sp. Y61]|uniref:Proline reductase-associated electron transfer protein PrdC n=1 Tax=Sporolactobacillus sp. Y61 TaxID=3160863 RepID=A0AAU8IG24_9BACL